ncbi:MAG: hypothetical protein ACE366_03335 [Bradymonadia bacterium]
MSRLNPWPMIAAMALMGCVENADETGSDPTPDMMMAAPDAASGGAGGGAGGMGGAAGEGGAMPDAALPDAAGGAGGEMPDMMPPPNDSCPEACERIVSCTVQLCPGADDLDLDALDASCQNVCADNPSVAVVVNGSDACADVVGFASGQGLDDAYEAACTPDLPPPDPMSCPYECAESERCIGGRCLREDGTCDTDYHCEAETQTCREGQCRPAQFARCQGADDCDEGQRCERFGMGNLQPGYCVIECARNEDCPINESCTQGYCNYTYCGMVLANGQVNSECTINDSPGACFPLPLGDPANPTNFGICIEGGTALEGETCDAQAEARDEAETALRCAAGSFCFGDPDDPLQPGAPQDGRGECAALCNPLAANTCAEGRTCVNFSNGDDPTTPGYDETRVLGICLEADCSVVGEESCEEGGTCRPLTILIEEGQCGPAGASPFGGPCETAEDCADGFCNDLGDGTLVCMDYCELGAESCGPNSVCFEQPGWAWGICFPVPEMEMGEE